MISPKKKIDRPQYVEPKTFGPGCLLLKKILIGCGVVLMTFVGMAIVGIVTKYRDLSKSHRLNSCVLSCSPTGF